LTTKGPQLLVDNTETMRSADRFEQTPIALARAAVGLARNQAARIHFRGADSRHESQQWKTVSTTNGPRQLSWPQVTLWACADRKEATIDSAGATA
jgi:hypothetical protein